MKAPRTTIIMIHGFRGTHHGLQRIADELPDSYQLIIPDLPGFGDGEVLDQYDIDSYVTWLYDFIAKQSLSAPPVLLGHSFGSIITAAYAKRYPDTITQLILVNPIGAPALEGPRGILTKLAQGYYWLGAKLPDRAATRWLSAKPIVYIMSATMTKTSDRSLRSWIHDQHYTYFSTFHSPRSVLAAFNTSVSQSVRDSAGDISTPTLLIAGERDDITTVAKQRELEARFADAKLIVIPEVGHLTHYETPERVASDIAAFLDDNHSHSNE